MTFTALLSALGLAPKTIPQATATLETAKSTFDSVNALFANAGLNLDTMLAAGPDALKAHLATISAKDGELATALAKVTELEGKVQTINASLTAEAAKFSVVGSALAPLGITAATKPEEYSGLIAAHVKKESALELAKGGHRPIDDVIEKQGKAEAIDANLTGIARVQAAFAAQNAARMKAK